jgi:hypothetical protein
MRSTIGLLTAACLAAGGAASYGQAPPVSVPMGPYGYSYTQTAPAPAPMPEQSPSLRQRLANLFHRQPSAPAPMMVQPRPVYQSPEPALADPPPHPAPQAAPARPTSFATPAPAGPVSYAAPAPAGVVPANHQEKVEKAPEVSKENVLRVAIADDATWIIGELHYVHADGGLWVLRYAPLDKEDRYGGAVVLARGQDMSKFQEGDLVFVKGSILDEGRASKSLAAPLYRATSIELNERPSEVVTHQPTPQ